MKKLPLVAIEMSLSFIDHYPKRWDKFNNDAELMNERDEDENSLLCRIQYCVYNGYLDAFNRNRIKMKKLSCKAVRIRSLVVDFITSIYECKTSENFNYCHNETCEKIVCVIDLPALSGVYGFAQKIVNMSLKYYYNEHHFQNNNIQRESLAINVGNIAQLFHTPIDNILLNNLNLIISADYRGEYDFRILNHPWSKWSQKEYLKCKTFLRNHLKNDVSLLEMEYHIWSAKIENNLVKIEEPEMIALNIKSKTMNLNDYKNIFFKPF
jgi:hypothetical protein